MSSLITLDPSSRNYNRAGANYRHERPQTISPWGCCRLQPTTTHVLEIWEMTIGKDATLQQWAIEAHNLYEYSLTPSVFRRFRGPTRWLDKDNLQVEDLPALSEV